MYGIQYPDNCQKKTKKLIYGQLRTGARAKDFEIAIQWLKDCGLIHLVHNVLKPGYPLKSYEEMDSFKIYLNDIGLLCAMRDVDINSILDENKFFTEFKGAITEQYVLQELKPTVIFRFTITQLPILPEKLIS